MAGVISAGKPSLQGFGGDGLFCHPVHAEISIASRGDRRLVEGIEVGQGLEIPLEGQVPLLEELDIRLAVGEEFLLEIELDTTRHLVVVPLLEFLAALDTHTLGQVRLFGWHGAHIVLVGLGIEQMREVTFFQFREAKGLGKSRQWHLEKGEGVDVANLPHHQLQDLGPIPDLFQHPLLTVVFIHHRVAVIPLKIVGQHREGTFGVLGQVIQPQSKVPNAHLAPEMEGSFLLLGLGHHQTGDVLSILLSTLDVEEDVERLVFFLLGWRRHLDVEAVGSNLHLLPTGRTRSIPTLMFLPLFSSPQQLETGGTLFSALADRGATGSRRFPVVGESQVIGQTGGAIEGVPTRRAGQDGGPVVSIGFSVIRAHILQAA